MATSQPPVGWKPTGDGGYRNPASGTVIYPNGKGGWQANPNTGPRPGALGHQNRVVNPQDYPMPPRGAGVVDRSAGFGGGTDPGVMSPSQVRAMQQFLVNHGFNVAVDGIYGPITKAAAAAFRANHKGGEAFNKAHGIGVHPTNRDVAPGGRGPAGGGAGGGTPPPAGGGVGGGGVDTGGYGGAFDSLLSALLAGGGRVGSMLDAKSFGDAAAAPQDALAAALMRQIAANPKQESQNQFDISSWYGLDPKAKGYQLSVLGRLGTARERDAQAATDAANSAQGIAQALAGSIGGAANGASGMVLGAGADAAGTAAALGEAQKQYADDVNPLLAAEARGAMSKEKAANSQALLDLQDKLAQARGQSRSDRAAAVAQIADKNNSLAQQRFANEGNLLSTLAQLQAVDPQASNLKDKKLLAQIAEIQAQTRAANARASGSVGSGSMPKIDLAGAGDSIAGLLGIGSDHQLPAGTSVTKLAYTIGSQLQGMGLKKGTPQYQRFGQLLISMFKDANGNPIVPPASWFGPHS